MGRFPFATPTRGPRIERKRHTTLCSSTAAHRVRRARDAGDEAARGPQDKRGPIGVVCRSSHMELPVMTRSQCCATGTDCRHAVVLFFFFQALATPTPMGAERFRGDLREAPACRAGCSNTYTSRTANVGLTERDRRVASVCSGSGLRGRAAFPCRRLFKRRVAEIRGPWSWAARDPA